VENKGLPNFIQTNVIVSDLPESHLSKKQLLALNEEFLSDYAAQSDPQIIFDVCKSYAEKGSSEAHYLLGLWYEQGDGKQQYIQLAAMSYWRASHLGKAEAQYNLALLCVHGGGAEPDLITAFYWFEKAANSGVKQAIYNLASFYDQGLGCVEDKKAAFLLYEKAANLGFYKAWFNLAVMFYEGEGIEPNSILAYAWVLLATEARVDEAIKFESRLKNALSDDQIQAGKQYFEMLHKQYKHFMPNVDQDAISLFNSALDS